MATIKSYGDFDESYCLKCGVDLQGTFGLHSKCKHCGSSELIFIKYHFVKITNPFLWKLNPMMTVTRYRFYKGTLMSENMMNYLISIERDI